MRKGLAAALSALLLAGASGLYAQGAPASPQQPAVALTVDQAVARALANQPLIQQAQAAVEAARARVGEASSTYYPFVSGTASYNRLSDQAFALSSLLPPPSTLQQLGITIPPNIEPLLSSPMSLVPVNMWDFNVGLNQVIFQFGKRGIQVRLAESGVAAARIGVDQIRTSLAYQAAQGFCTLLFLKGQLAALDKELANLQEHLQATRIKAQAGAATRYDELATEVRISALQSQRIEAENQLTRQSIGLKQLLGIDVGTSLDPKGDITPGSEALGDPQALLASAMERRPDVRQAAEAEQAAELGRRLASMGAWPTVSGHASIGYKNGILPDINTPVLNWVAGVQVSVPIFQGFLVAHQSEEADKKLLAARENSLAVRRTAATQVLQAIQDVEAARQQVQSAQTQLDEANQMLEVVKLQYDLGMLTNLEYLDGQAAVERAELGSLLAKYHEVLAEYGLQQATGAPIWPARDSVAPAAENSPAPTPAR